MDRRSAVALSTRRDRSYSSVETSRLTSNISTVEWAGDNGKNVTKYHISWRIKIAHPIGYSPTS